VAASTAAPEPVAAAGHRVGRFALIRLLGRGGMGEVWAARDLELDREVAIKLLDVDFGGMGHERQARLRREAQAMARVNHPNIVQIYELGADRDRLFCAMELVDGQTLRQWLETPRPWRATLDVLLAAGRGVAAAHAAGLVHRDVKPDNVMVARDGRVVVADFGLAKLTEMDQAGGDALSDQFWFCVMACEALYGSRPSGGSTPGELMASVHEQPASPRPARRPPPRGVWRCLRRGLAVAVEERWPTMEPLLSGLERAAAAPRRRRVAIAAAAVVVALAASSVVALAPPQRDDEELAREAGENRMAAVWSPARRDGMRTAFAGASEPAVASQATSTSSALDRYRDAWLAMRIDAWRATNRRNAQSARLLELRMRCLDRLADEMDAFLQLAAEADQPDELRRIAQGVGRLTPVATCTDEGSMAAVFPSTIDDDRPDLREKFDVEEARMRAAIAAMPPAEAMKAINAAIAEADEAKVPGLSSGLLFLLAVTQNEVNDVGGAEATLRRMIQEAARTRRHFMVAGGWLRLMRLIARQHRLDEAIALEPIARAAVAQAGDEPALRAELAETMAAIAWEKKDLKGTLHHYLEARDILIAARDPRNEVTARIEANAAEAAFWVGDLDEAHRLAEHAYSILSLYPGEDRPAANALMVLAWVARERKDWESVARHSKDAVAQLARLHGTDNPDLAVARRELGLALGQLGRHDEAIEQVSRSAEVFRRLDAHHPDTAAVALELGELYEKAGRTLDAEQSNRTAVELVRGQGVKARPHLGRALLALARMVAYRAPSEAIPIYDEGLRIVAGLPDVDVEEQVEALREMANAALATRRARWMLTWFDRLPVAAARLPALRRRLVVAARRR
jgi:serine/threonine-protein kinase